MAVQFILGRSGTGKTHACVQGVIDALLEEGAFDPLILLVPEQATYQAERAVLSDTRIGGYHRLHILSFERLAFLLVDADAALPGISRVGREMIVHQLLRRHSAQLMVFGSAAERPGLAAKIVQTITELQHYDKSPEDVLRLADSLREGGRDGITARKLADLALIFGGYCEFLSGRFANPDTQLTAAREAEANLERFRNCRLWVDGFAGFTAQENAMLLTMLRVAGEAKIALCLDPGAVPSIGSNNSSGNGSSDGNSNGSGGQAAAGMGEPSLFGPTERTYVDLLERVEQFRLEVKPPVLLERPCRFASVPALAHIERHVFQQGGFRQQQAGESVKIVAASNPRAEVVYVARGIERLVREDRGLRYRDVAVIVSNIDSYQPYLEAVFRDYGIPFFLDTLRPARRHPLVELLNTVADVVVNGVTSRGVFDYLKTDLVGMERWDVDRLENYCLEFGVGARDWLSEDDWRYAGDGRRSEHDEGVINRLRREAIGPLVELTEQLHRDERISAAGFVRSVFCFCERLGVRGTLGEWIEQLTADELARANGGVGSEAEGQDNVVGKVGRGDDEWLSGQEDYDRPEYHQQCYQAVVDVLDELVTVFEGQELELGELADVLQAALGQLALAFIPPRLDQVLVGTIDRSRHPDLKVAFIIGACQGRFPVPVSFESILTDEDRCVAEEAGFLLAERAEQKLTDREYLAYIAFTRPSQYLCITYPQADSSGRPLLPSPFLGNVSRLFVGFEEDRAAEDGVGLQNVYCATELADWMADGLSEKESGIGSQRQVFEKLQADARAKGISCRALRSVSEAAMYDNRAELEPDVARELFGRELNCSVTRLSRFAACAYSHFASSVLDLRRRQLFRMEPLELGSFYHELLDRVMKGMLRDGSDLAAADDDELVGRVQGAVDGLVGGDGFYGNFARHSRHNRYMIESASQTVQDCMVALGAICAAGQFRPIASEVTFGKSGQGLGDVSLELSAGRRLRLHGKIDRVDVAEVDGRRLAVVFDYKSSERSVNWSRLYHGLDLQLPTYLLAVEAGELGPGGLTIDAAVGAFYIPVRVSGARPTDAEDSSARIADRKAKGLLDGESFGYMDSRPEGAGPAYYNVRVTKGKGVYGYYGDSAALTPNDFRSLQKLVRTQLTDLSEGIIAGHIDIKPYRLGGESPCSYCDYRSLCRFDWHTNDYNFLDTMKKTDVLESV